MVRKTEYTKVTSHRPKGEHTEFRAFEKTTSRWVWVRGIEFKTQKEYDMLMEYKCTNPPRTYNEKEKFVPRKIVEKRVNKGRTLYSVRFVGWNDSKFDEEYTGPQLRAYARGYLIGAFNAAERKKKKKVAAKKAPKLSNVAAPITGRRLLVRNPIQDDEDMEDEDEEDEHQEDDKGQDGHGNQEDVSDEESTDMSSEEEDDPMEEGEDDVPQIPRRMQSPQRRDLDNIGHNYQLMDGRNEVPSRSPTPPIGFDGLVDGPEFDYNGMDYQEPIDVGNPILEVIPVNEENDNGDDFDEMEVDDEDVEELEEAQPVGAEFPADVPALEHHVDEREERNMDHDAEQLMAPIPAPAPAAHPGPVPARIAPADNFIARVNVPLGEGAFVLDPDINWNDGDVPIFDEVADMMAQIPVPAPVNEPVLAPAAHPDPIPAPPLVRDVSNVLEDGIHHFNIAEAAAEPGFVPADAPPLAPAEPILAFLPPTLIAFWNNYMYERDHLQQPADNALVHFLLALNAFLPVPPNTEHPLRVVDVTDLGEDERLAAGRADTPDIILTPIRSRLDNIEPLERYGIIHALHNIFHHFVFQNREPHWILAHCATEVLRSYRFEYYENHELKLQAIRDFMAIAWWERYGPAQPVVSDEEMWSDFLRICNGTLVTF